MQVSSHIIKTPLKCFSDFFWAPLIESVFEIQPFVNTRTKHYWHNGIFDQIVKAAWWDELGTKVHVYYVDRLFSLDLTSAIFGVPEQ